jgi:hypothetical protein
LEINKIEYSNDIEFNRKLSLKMKELISISNTCLESYPCKHHITYFDNNDKFQKDTVCERTIYSILIDDSIVKRFDTSEVIKHFECYKKDVNISE